jgi:hypothetical protein
MNETLTSNQNRHSGSVKGETLMHAGDVASDNFAHQLQIKKKQRVLSTEFNVREIGYITWYIIESK